MRITPDIEIATGVIGGKRVVVIAVFADFVILKAAAQRRQQQDRAFQRVRRNVFDDARHQKAIQRMVADLYGRDRLRQIVADGGTLRANDLIRLRVADALGLAVNDSLIQLTRDRGYVEMEKLLAARYASLHGASPQGVAVAEAIRACQRGGRRPRIVGQAAVALRTRLAQTSRVPRLVSRRENA